MSLPAERSIQDVGFPSGRMRFVGRTDERARLVAALRDPSERVVTLTGSGGAGKTRLLIEAAEAWLATCPSESALFVDGVALPSGEHLLPAIVAQLGLDPAGRTPGEHLSEYLAGKPTVLLLDNMEHLLGAVVELATLLRACHGIRIFATSRSPLRLTGERRIEVEPLPSITAVELFVDRAERVGIERETLDAQHATVETICAQLDGLPLAIELAAARLRILSPRALLANLTHQLTVLTDGPIDAQPHHRAMRNAIDWSYHLLTPLEQALLARLSVFPESFSLDLAAAVCMTGFPEEADPLARLASLIDQGLLSRTTDPDRFRMLIAIREFALEQLDERGERSELERRLTSRMVEMAEAIEPELIGPNQEHAFAQLAVETPNLRRAFDIQLATGDIAGALRLSAAIWRSWLMSLRWEEAAQTYTRIFAQAPLEPTLVWARALRGAAVIAEARTVWADAERWNRVAIATFAELGDRGAEARSLIDLGNIYNSTGRFELARDYYRRAGELSEKIGEARVALVALASLGGVELRRGRLRAAAEHYTAALPAARRLDDPWLLAMILSNFGAVLAGLHRNDEAAAMHQEALEIRTELGDEYGIATALANLSSVEPDPDRAEALAVEALERARVVGAADTLTGALIVVGMRAFDRGERQVAADRLIEALDVAFAADDEIGCAGIVELLAELLESVDRENAVRILGATARLRHDRSMDRTGDYAERSQALEERLRQSLGHARFRELTRIGEARSLADIIVAITLDARAAARRPGATAADEPLRTLPPLSPRELDVLRLIAEGKTDRQIGDELFISPKTVNHHATHILTKLECRNRAAAVAVATQHGLLDR